MMTPVRASANLDLLSSLLVSESLPHPPVSLQQPVLAAWLHGQWHRGLALPISGPATAVCLWALWPTMPTSMFEAAECLWALWLAMWGAG